MKTRRLPLTATLLALSLLGGGIRAHSIDCLAAPFLKLTDARKEIVEVLTQRVKSLTPAIQRSPRWASIPNAADKVVAADAQLQRSMSRAEKQVEDLAAGTTLGSSTSDAYADILGSSRVITSTADLDRAGDAVGKLFARKGDTYSQELLALRKGTIDFLNGPPNNVIFSEAEMLNDLATVFEVLPSTEIDKVLDPLHGVANWGPLGEVHGIGVLKREQNVKVIAIEPTYNGVGGRKPVDFVGDNGLVYQHKVTTDLISATMNDPNIAADIIAVEAQTGAGSFRFSFNQGDPSALATQIQSLNASLAAAGSTRVLTLADFVKLPWDR